MKIQWNMRLEKDELERWKVEAAKEGKLLTEWIRGRCSEVTVSVGTGALPAASPPSWHHEPGECANCGHRKSRHGGFRTCCQEDNCLCVGFKGE